jgi:hypothetical protein
MRFALFLVFAIFVSGLYAGNDDRKDSHGLFTELLAQYVHDGKVNYNELRKDDRLEKYLSQLSQTNPETIENDKDRLAFWINAYNAFTLKTICENYPVESIKDLSFGGSVLGKVLNTTAWDKKFIEINGMEMSLNHIEHEIIRKKFKDPRIHFALVCAAVSCPPLRSEAYEGYKLDEQLNEQGKIFFGDKSKNYFEVDKQVAHLSKILDWYGSDFGANGAELLRAIAPFLPAQIASAVEKNPDAWKIEYNDYDWSLNE